MTTSSSSRWEAQDRSARDAEVVQTLGSARRLLLLLLIMDHKVAPWCVAIRLFNTETIGSASMHPATRPCCASGSVLLYDIATGGPFAVTDFARTQHIAFAALTVVTLVLLRSLSPEP